MGLISSIMFRKAKNALKDFNGVMTWDYSQMDYGVLTIIRKDKISANGICKALAAQWIVDHAYGGSLANRVTNAAGNVDVDAIRMIMQNFCIAWDSQEAETASFLTSRGIIERMRSRNVTGTKTVRVDGRRVEITKTAATSGGMSQAGNSHVAIELAQALKGVTNGYAQIDFGGSGVGHATAAWVGGPSYGSAGDACFYDPNFGEVWFQGKKDFFGWFELFYRYSYQGFPCNFNSRWSVNQWGLSVNASKGAYAKAVLSASGNDRFTRPAR